jgi:predicted outer membrane repeat protein
VPNSNSITIYGTSTFSNNTAGGRGGAIFVYSNVNITASIGDIVFEGNKANNSPNAIYMWNISNNYNNTLSLSATNGNKVEFYDPISSYDASYTNLTIKINEGDKTGTVLFDMSNYTDPSHKVSEIYGNTTVYNGTFALKGGAVYGADTNARAFTLNNTATLLVAGKNNKINSSGIVTLAGTLAFDLTGVTAATDTALTFNGNTSGTPS